MSDSIKHVIVPEQCRAARALLGWSQDQLEAASSVAKKTIADFERGARSPYARTLVDVRAALETAGVEFIPENGGGPGARLRQRSVATEATAKATSGGRGSKRKASAASK